jgi:hypothetical protein
MDWVANMKAQSTADDTVSKLFPMESSEMGEEEMEKFFEYLDTDGDEIVTKEELLNLF